MIVIIVKSPVKIRGTNLEFTCGNLVIIAGRLLQHIFASLSLYVSVHGACAVHIFGISPIYIINRK